MTNAANGNGVDGLELANHQANPMLAPVNATRPQPYMAYPAARHSVHMSRHARRIVLGKSIDFPLTFPSKAGGPECSAHQGSQRLTDLPIDNGNPQLRDLIDFRLAFQAREADGQLTVAVGR